VVVVCVWGGLWGRGAGGYVWSEQLQDCLLVLVLLVSP